MKPALTERAVRSSGVLSSGSFGISQENQVHILTILRDTLYTNKVLAVLREYGANAWDAHREVGKEELPIKVVLPTELEASLIIRDFGPGLSEQDVYEVYTQYGASTKRTSNVAVGMLGIGSKSAFAYNDSFSITSFNGGLKRVYHAVLDETNIGVVMKVWEAALGKYLMAFLASEGVEKDLDPNMYYGLSDHLSNEIPSDLAEALAGGDPMAEAHVLRFPTSQVARFQAWITENSPEAETGIEIKVPVNPNDVALFKKEAERLFRYFQPMPDINIPLTAPRATWEAKNGFLRRASEGRYDDDWVAVMGCVPYRLNLGNLTQDLEKAGLSSVVSNLRGGIYFDIGGADISANREELEYKQRTKDAIIEKLKAVLDEVSTEVDAVVADASSSDWKKRLSLIGFTAKTGIPLTEKFAEWRSVGFVQLYSTDPVKDEKGLQLQDDEGDPILTGPKSFTLRVRERTYGSRGQKFRLKEDPRVPTSENARILIKDTTRPFRGYVSSDIDRVVSIREGNSVDTAIVELEALLLEKKLTGIPILKMSEMAYTPINEGTGKTSNPKHGQKYFVLNGTNTSSRRGLSENWESTDREADQDDVFVIINRFEPVSWGPGDFFQTVVQDRRILKSIFNEDFPEIYGIKTTAKAPVKPEDLEGTPYREWRTKTFKEALAMHPEIQEALNARSWVGLDIGINHWRIRTSDAQIFEVLKGKLDGRNRLVRMLSERTQANGVLQGFYKKHPGKKDSLNDLGRILKTDGAAEKALERIYSVYPLLSPSNGNENGLSVFAGPSAQHWFNYINLIDSKGN